MPSPRRRPRGAALCAVVIVSAAAAAVPAAAAFQSTPRQPSPPTSCVTRRRPRSFDWTRSYTLQSDGESTERVPTLSIHSLLEEGRVDDAVAELRGAAGEVPPSTYHAVLEACCAGGIEPKRSKKKATRNDEDRIETAAELLGAMEGATAHAHEIVISGYARRGRWQEASQTLTALEDASPDANPSLNAYQTVLQAFANANQFSQMSSLLTKMRRNRVRPNVYTYNSLLKICASDRTPRWKEALSLLSQCQREPGVDPDLITYTTAMKACARGRQAGKALELFRAAKDLGMELDVYCYTTAMDACAKTRRWKKALSLLDEMKGEGIEPNDVTYGVAVAACGNGGQWKRALELLEQMRAMELRINTITYNSAIAALSKAARVESKQHSGEADADVLWQKALDLVKSMERENVRRDQFTFSSSISTCGAAGRWEEAVNLIRQMKSDGIKPNKVAYTSAISACANSKRWEPAFELFQKMKGEGLTPDLVAYNALIGAGMAAEKPLEVFGLWLEMCQEGNERISPDIVTLTEVIATLDGAMGKANRERVDKVFVEAVSRGLILRKDSLDTSWEVDLSHMSFPIARAACRYIFRQIAERHGEGEGGEVKDLSLITGASRMREYVREVLRDELKPGVFCIVPKMEQGTLLVKEKMLMQFIQGQGEQ